MKKHEIELDDIDQMFADLTNELRNGQHIPAFERVCFWCDGGSRSPIVAGGGENGDQDPFICEECLDRW